MEFNLIIAGVGGQGGLTLSRIIGNAAMKEGYNVRIGETLGMSQRYGSVLSYLRFGEEVYSPLIEEGEADLMLALEPAEALRNARFLSARSYVILNAYPIQTATTLVGKERYPPIKEVERVISRICPIDVKNFQEEAEGINSRTLGVLMLGYAYGKGLIPLKKESLKDGIREMLKEKLWEINFNALERGIELARR